MNSRGANYTKKRSRNSVGERNNFCGCGKHYLSYPALYTHVRNKHDGKFPDGSMIKKEIQQKTDGQLIKLESVKNDVAEFIKKIREHP